MSAEKYAVKLRRDVEKEILRLPRQVARRVVKKLKVLAENPRPRGCRKLSIGKGYRVRAGDYRCMRLTTRNAK